MKGNGANVLISSMRGVLDLHMRLLLLLLLSPSIMQWLIGSETGNAFLMISALTTELVSHTRLTECLMRCLSISGAGYE